MENVCARNCSNILYSFRQGSSGLARVSCNNHVAGGRYISLYWHHLQNHVTNIKLTWHVIYAFACVHNDGWPCHSEVLETAISFLHPRAILTGFMIDKIALRQVSLWVVNTPVFSCWLSFTHCTEVLTYHPHLIRHTRRQVISSSVIGCSFTYNVALEGFYVRDLAYFMAGA
jgi:hypothetical protein